METEKDILEGKKILIGITGSIAAYKIASLVSLLKKRKADIHVLMTNNATKNPRGMLVPCGFLWLDRSCRMW